MAKAGSHYPFQGNHGLRIFISQWQMYAMVALPVVYLLIFCYGPMFGVIMAFKDYSIRKGVWGSPWVGFKYFEQFLTMPVFTQLLTNTLSLSVYSMIAEFIFPILLALGLNEVNKVYFKKTVQMMTYFPYFISTVVLVGMLLQMLSLNGGLFNNVRSLFGLPALNFMGVPKWWRSIYVWSGVWQSSGYRAVIYIAALSAVDTQLVEAAVIDGASRVQRVIHIDIPSMIPTVTIMLILAVGNMMAVGFEKVYLMQNNLNLNISEIISTYVYKKGLLNSQYSYSTAVGLFNSVVNFALIITANAAAGRIGETKLW